MKCYACKRYHRAACHERLLRPLPLRNGYAMQCHSAHCGGAYPETRTKAMLIALLCIVGFIALIPCWLWLKLKGNDT